MVDGSAGSRGYRVYSRAAAHPDQEGPHAPSAGPEHQTEVLLLQEAESRSGVAKLRWFEKEGMLVMNLQHGGILVAEGMSAAEGDLLGMIFGREGELWRAGTDLNAGFASVPVGYEVTVTGTRAKRGGLQSSESRPQRLRSKP